MNALEVDEKLMAKLGNIVVVAEKPSVARDLARVVGTFKQCDGYLPQTPLSSTSDSPSGSRMDLHLLVKRPVGRTNKKGSINFIEPFGQLF